MDCKGEYKGKCKGGNEGKCKGEYKWKIESKLNNNTWIQNHYRGKLIKLQTFLSEIISE